MPSSTVRDIPEKVIEQLRRAAAEEQLSMNAQALHWLEQAARKWMSVEERTELLRVIRSSRHAISQRYGQGSDNVRIIRRMRDQRAKIGL